MNRVKLNKLTKRSKKYKSESAGQWSQGIVLDEWGFRQAHPASSTAEVPGIVNGRGLLASIYCRVVDGAVVQPVIGGPKILSVRLSMILKRLIAEEARGDRLASSNLSLHAILHDVMAECFMRNFPVGLDAWIQQQHVPCGFWSSVSGG